jgi:hypothetical protein
MFYDKNLQESETHTQDTLNLSDKSNPIPNQAI